MDRVLFDYAKLKGRITEKCGTQKEFAKRLGISETALTTKLSGKAYFSQPQIEKSVGVLDIPLGEVGIFFYTASSKN